jgi:hypothetical protein
MALTKIPSSLLDTTSGLSLSGDITLVDNDKAIFGTGSDLQIYHNGSNSYIRETGTGDLYIQGTQLRLQSSTGESFFVGVADGASYVYHNGSAKLNTTATGIDVTGNIVVSGTVDGRDIATDGTKLDTIETNADVTDTTNVTAAGALMDTEITNLAQVKAFDSADYATAAQGTTADSALQNIVEDTTPQLGGDLASNGNDILFGDSDKAIFGASSDLQMYHDGANSFIRDSGTGSLFIRGTSLVLEDADGNDYIAMTDTGTGGTVEIKHEAVTKLTTSSTGIDITGNITVSGTVDGRDLATDGTKLDGIEANATADQTQSDINALAITEVGTISTGTWQGTAIASAYLDSDTAHLSGAQTFTGVKTFASPVINTGISGTAILDEDNMASNSATQLATQQSIKAYVDAEVAGVVDSAPAALDTLNELAAALGDDANFSTTTSTALGNRLRVDTAAQGLTGTQQANAITNLGITATKAELNFVDGVTSNIQTQLDGKQASGSYLTGNQTITLSGDVSGSGTTSIAVTIADDSHNHVISNVDGLQTALDAKLASSSYTAADVLTKIKTVDGAGSGLDADLLDGISSASFLRSDADDTHSGTLTVTTALNIADSNTSLQEGGADTLRIQTGTGYIDIGSKNSSYAHFATDRGKFYFDSAVHFDGQIYNYVAGGTSDPYWRAGNDGAGSGLDADLLDGQQGSYYAPASTALTTSTSFGGDVSGTYNAIVIADDSHNHVISNVDGLQTALDGKTSLDHIRSLGVTAFTGGTDPNITTAQYISEMEGDGAFDSYSSVFKTTWNYAGNYNLSDAGSFGPTETAGMSHITWTDNSSDSTRGNITVLAIAPTTGGSAGGVYVYNDQGSSYTPGWREIWTSSTDGAGSGLDADKLDAQQGSYYLDYNNFTNTPTIPSLSGYATESYVGTQISNLVDSAPSTLDTLNELAAALGDDANFSTTVTNSIATKAPLASPSFTGNITVAGDGFFNGTKLEGDSKEMLRYNDSWLRVNPANEFTSGIYCGSGLLRTDGEFQVGSSGAYFKVTSAGNVTLAGTLDGRDIAADGSKLDGIESGATADQTAAEILTAIKTVDGSGSGLDADLLDGQSSAYYQPASSALTTSTSFGGDVSGTYNAIVIANDSHTHTFDNLTGKQAGTGDYSTSGDLVAGRGSGSIAMTINDGYGNSNLTFNHQSGTPDQNGNAARIEVNTDSSTNASMNFEVKSGVTGGTPVGLTTVLNLAEGVAAVTGNITVTGTVDGRDIASDGSKLDGIESGATADQTAAEILTAIKTVDGSGSGLDADLLDGISSASFVRSDATDTLTGAYTFTNNTNLKIRAATNAVGTGIEFSDSAGSSYAQAGSLEFFHSDGMSYGSGASFILGSTESTTTILADGKLMYGEGIYSKPSSGTGAGTRKDSNWDTAYGWGNHASAGYITGNQTITLSGDASGSGTTSIAVTVANDSHNHSSSSGDFTINGGNLYTGTSQQRVKVAVWSGTTYGIGMQSGYTFGGIGNEYVLTNQMSNTDARGFWWGDSSHTNAQGAMALTTQGYLTVANRIRVGYGESDTTTPSKDLDVSGEASIGSLMVGATTTPAMQLQVKDTTNYHGILVNGNAAPSVCFDTSTGTTPEWKVGISGNNATKFAISKGTANDDKLTIDSSGNAAVSGNVTAYSSDERLKTNITPIENPIEKVKQLNGVEFDWKDNVEELGFTPRVKHETGVIAQNVQSVIPDATPNAPFNEEYLTVQHEKIIPVLIEAIKEQQKQIDDLKQQINEQKEIK